MMCGNGARAMIIILEIPKKLPLIGTTEGREGIHLVIRKVGTFMVQDEIVELDTAMDDLTRSRNRVNTKRAPEDSPRLDKMTKSILNEDPHVRQVMIKSILASII